MSELQVIEKTLLEASRRLRVARALHGGWRGLLAGACGSLVLMVVYLLFPVPAEVLMWTAVIPAAGLLVGAVAGGWRRFTLAETARWVDQKTRMKERLSTAVELAAAKEEGAWKDLVIADAAAHAGEVEPRKLVALTLSRASRWACLVLAVVAGLGFVPEYRSKAHLQKAADKENIKDVGRRLSELTRRNLEKRTPAMEATQKSLEAVNEVGEKLSKANLTRGEALKDLASMTDKLKQQLNDLSKDPSLKRLEEAARAGGGQGQSQSGDQKQMEALQQKVGKNPPTQEAFDAMRQKLEKIQSVARAMASDPSAVSDADRQKTSQALAELSRQAEGMGLQMPELEAAMEALAANQSEMFLKDMDAALLNLDKLKDMAKALQQMQQSGQAPGKDLAEQLQRGQAESAASTLRQMARELRSGKLSPEEFQRMMDEVQRALKPAAKYGKVGEHLRESARNMKSKNASDAAEGMERAAEELDKLMQQMSDADMMMAELAALQQASMCVGTGQGWGACNRPGMKPGKRPGAGVGTWADEGASEEQAMTDRWDNSGMVRPDLAPRGLTEREPTDPGDALKPTRVRGQFSPGGEMPSVPLKGVSIKGQSAVDYKAATAAAQSEAESALSQEKVPKMYQGAVKNYFDDLKK